MGRLSPQMSASLSDALGVTIVGSEALSGGSINAAWALELGDGRQVFAKTNKHAPPDMFAAEARGLGRLSDAGALRVPDVLEVGPRFLVLEWVEAGPPCAAHERELGRGLARLHRCTAPCFGLDHSNYIGTIEQDNTHTADWPSFYRAQRLEPLLARGAARGLVDASLRRRFDHLFSRLPELCGPAEAPACLHGDLWVGNLHRDGAGRPVLIDPAVYFGHREVDLAMMRLFGGVDARTFAAYAESWPLAAGWERRVDLYQLYPLLVHVLLFGGSYLAGVDAALGRLA